MRMGRIAVVAVAVCMVSIPVFAQSSKKAQRPSMSLVGCLVGEKAYKAVHEGKVPSASAIADDEYVLADASESSSADAPGRCTGAGNGKAYRLVGKQTRELKQFVGRRIEITGAFEEDRDAKIAAGEKRSSLPPEVTVASFREVREVAASISPSPVTASAAPAPAAVAPAPAPSPAPEATEARNETPEALPTTASNLPLIGLIGLLFLGAAFGLHLARPRMS